MVCNNMKKIYIQPELTQTQISVGNIIASSFISQLGTDEIDGGDVLVKGDSENFWGEPSWGSED